MAEILKTINGQIITDIGSTKVTTLDGQIVSKFTTKDKPPIIVVPTATNISTVMGVALSSVSTVMGVASANISTIMGVSNE